MNIAAYVLASFVLLMSAFLFIRIPAPKGFIIWFPKLAAGALSSVWLIVAGIATIFAWASSSIVVVVEGLIGVACMAWYIGRVTKSGKKIDPTVFRDFSTKIAVERQKSLLKRPWMGFLVEKDQSKSCLNPDIPFWTIPGTERQLLCDIWQPAHGSRQSGLALIFFHGSAWYLLDKDYGTRPLFNHLVSQGHVVMDVAYRLCPEVDIFGMVGDVKRATTWMKANGNRYGVDPDRIVLAGASAGGHLSLLAAYAPDDARLTPDDVRYADLQVRGVISLYGPSDLRAVYAHTNQQNLVGLPKVVIGQKAAGEKKNMRDAGRLDILLGGHPSDVPDMYDLASPVCHVHPGCPPTLLIQGEHDLITPISATRSLYRKLIENENMAISIEFPYTDHGFDLMLPVLSPSYQCALYYIDRFLAALE